MSVSKVTGTHIVKKLSAAFICIWLLLGVTFSAFFLAKEYDHHCHMDDCPICQTMAVCESFVNELGSVILTAAVAFACLVLTILLIKQSFEILCAPTPVSCKVRLNN